MVIVMTTMVMMMSGSNYQFTRRVSTDQIIDNPSCRRLPRPETPRAGHQATTNGLEVSYTSIDGCSPFGSVIRPPDNFISKMPHYQQYQIQHFQPFSYLYLLTQTQRLILCQKVQNCTYGQSHTITRHPSFDLRFSRVSSHSIIQIFHKVFWAWHVVSSFSSHSMIQIFLQVLLGTTIHFLVAPINISTHTQWS